MRSATGIVGVDAELLEIGVAIVLDEVAGKGVSDLAVVTVWGGAFLTVWTRALETELAAGTADPSEGSCGNI